MNVGHTLARNTAWYAGVTVVGLVSGLLMSVILARGLGPALMGDFSYVIWVQRTLTAVATLGFTVATVRYTAEAFARGDAARAGGVVRLFMRQQLVTTSLVTLVAVPLVLAAAASEIRAALLVVVAMLFLITIEGIYSHALQGAQRYDVTARTSTIKMGLQLVVALVAIRYGADLALLLAGMALTLVVSCLIQRRRVLTIYGETMHATPAPMTADVRAYLLPLSIVAALDAIVWDRCEVFFLGLYASSEDIADYSLAFGLATRIMIVPGIAVGALLPAFSALHGSGDPTEFGLLYQGVLRYVALAGAPLAAMVAALAPSLVVSLYGAAYLAAAPLVGVLAAVALLSALRQVAWAALRAVGDRRCALVATTVAAVINIGLAAILIPRWGTKGAVTANAAAQVTATLWAFAGMARAHRVSFPVLDVGKAVVAGVLSWFVAWELRGEATDLIRAAVAATGGLSTFVLVCVPTGLLGMREWGVLTAGTRRLLGVVAPGAPTR